VLDVLDKYSVKSTFFCVGDNVRKYPYLYEEILGSGHQVGNHTFHHLQGWLTAPDRFVEDTLETSRLIASNLFRPPHGHMIFPQPRLLKRKGYKVVMWDVVTRDYNAKLPPEQVLENVKRYTRDGSIIVFHDSLKAEKNMKFALPRSIEWLQKEGYTFEMIPGMPKLSKNRYYSSIPYPLTKREPGKATRSRYVPYCEAHTHVHPMGRYASRPEPWPPSARGSKKGYC
jgi:peptidoglycan/xylan/chitin deacetylase (PgdA/CDA1 family)